MNVIIINKEKSVRVDHFDWQISPNGRKFRLTGVKINEDKPSIFLDEKGVICSKFTKNRVEKYHWIYEFIYFEGDIFYIEIDYYDNFLKLSKKLL